MDFNFCPLGEPRPSLNERFGLASDTGFGWHQSNFGNSSNSVFVSYRPRLAKRTKIKVRTVTKDETYFQ